MLVRIAEKEEQKMQTEKIVRKEEAKVLFSFLYLSKQSFSNAWKKLFEGGSKKYIHAENLVRLHNKQNIRKD